MYGGEFKQTYGWYIKQAALRAGVEPAGFLSFLPNVCPCDIQAMIRQLKDIVTALNILAGYIDDPSQYKTNKFLNSGKHDSNSISKLAAKIRRQLWNVFEDQTRQEFGMRKIGDGWISESILHQIICGIFPKESIIRHYRPDWLEGLELDIYMPRLNIAFEYQGQQHYYPIKAWGGEKALEGLQERDSCKIEICEKRGVRLIIIRYTDSLTESYIRSMLK
jgi:hypothetical protein